MKEVKSLYKFLNETGDLFELVSGMTGNWEKDKKKFKKNYEQLQNLLEI